MNLFINSFIHQDKKRNKELEFCLERNQENKYIKKIFIVNRGERTTFGQFFEAMKEHPGEINILANTDIYFDETIRAAECIQKRECFALTRWEDYDNIIMPFNARHGRDTPMQWSQDAWIFRGAPDPKHFMEVNAVQQNRRVRIPFYLGIPGCDNKLAAILKGMQYKVTNPCYSIRAIHKHDEDGREYLDYHILEGIRPFGLVPPGSLTET